TNSAGCTASDTIVISFYSVTVPEITLQGDTLFSSLASGNQWYKNDVIISGAINNYYVPVSTGTYKVEITDSNNCHLISNSIFIQFTGLNETTSELLFILYPDPASSGILLSGSNEMCNHA